MKKYDFRILSLLVFVLLGIHFLLANNLQAETTVSTMPNFIIRFQADLGSLNRFHSITFSQTKYETLKGFFNAKREELNNINFNLLPHSEKVEWILMQNYIGKELKQLEFENKQIKNIEQLIPFSSVIIELFESRMKIEVMDAQKTAEKLNEIKNQIDIASERIRQGMNIDRSSANRAVNVINSYRNDLRRWYEFYYSYDPMFTWWCEQPYKAADTALQSYAGLVREQLVGSRRGDDIVIGDPIGREALIQELRSEMIAHTPEELIAIGEKEYEWCLNEIRKASRELGFGDDWKKAIEYVKTLHVEPGKQTYLVNELAHEAVEFLELKNLLTIPELAKTTWRMEMMSPERQRITPFFTGGEVISVAFPTAEMSHEEKLMSLRANNEHFSRAVVHHELIPGHHLQQFMNARNNTHRRIFSTPFWGEGWALYWELLLWDLDFARSAEDKVGMLYWRMHRCARIVFSLKFHMGMMTPEECVSYLIDKVGHERASAEGEVRRSFSGMYSPLYQAAYMIGGLQFYALHKEIVRSGKMTNKQFHDFILQQNSIPVEMVRVLITNQNISRDFQPGWKFYNQN